MIHRKLGIVLLWAASRGAALAQSPLSFRGVAVQADTGIIQVLAGDLNADGNADLVFLGTQNLTILLGNGDGTFQPAVHTSASGYSSMVVGDFNNDGKVDVAAFTPEGFIDTYLSRGDATFAPPLRSPGPGLPGSNVQVADFNADGNVDIVNAGSIAFGTGDGAFTASTPSGCTVEGGYPVPGAFGALYLRHCGFQFGRQARSRCRCSG